MDVGVLLGCWVVEVFRKSQERFTDLGDRGESRQTVRAQNFTLHNSCRLPGPALRASSPLPGVHGVSLAVAKISHALRIRERVLQMLWLSITLPIACRRSRDKAESTVPVTVYARLVSASPIFGSQIRIVRAGTEAAGVWRRKRRAF
jgi:hypothetical protein